MSVEAKINEMLGKKIVVIISAIAYLITNYYILSANISEIKAEVKLKTSDERIAEVVKQSIAQDGTYFPNSDGKVLIYAVKKLEENNNKLEELIKKLEDKVRR